MRSVFDARRVTRRLSFYRDGGVDHFRMADDPSATYWRPPQGVLSTLGYCRSRFFWREGCSIEPLCVQDVNGGFEQPFQGLYRENGDKSISESGRRGRRCEAWMCRDIIQTTLKGHSRHRGLLRAFTSFTLQHPDTALVRKCEDLQEGFTCRRRSVFDTT